jgi:hypothetical protein
VSHEVSTTRKVRSRLASSPKAARRPWRVKQIVDLFVHFRLNEVSSIDLFLTLFLIYPKES